MFNDSRIAIYDYLYNLFYNVVTRNVYSMGEPQELTKSDAEDGFIVILVGDIFDESEFTGNTYGWARCYVSAYVPPISRGRLDYDKFTNFENAINTVIRNATNVRTGDYSIQEGSVLSMDSVELDNANNQYYNFVKSFIINIG